MTTAAMVQPAKATDVNSVLNMQIEWLRTGNYEFIGKAWLIVLEAAKDAAVPQPSVANVLGTRLEFYGEGLPLAQSRDHSTLLLLAPVVRPDGSVGLPDIPDPEWVPPIPKEEELTRKYVAPQPPKIAQKLEDRARGTFPKSTREYFVFGPVQQVLIRPEGLPDGWIAQCFADPVSGTQMDLLIHKQTGRAHFFGGKFEIARIG